MNISIEFTEDELNMILKSLYLLEDQYWFRGQHLTEPLIVKLNEYLKEES
jgi:hypothetical protein